MILNMPLFVKSLDIDAIIKKPVPNLDEVPRNLLNSTLAFFTEAYTSDASVSEKRKFLFYVILNLKF